MCGRYASFTPPDALARVMKVLRQVPYIAPSWNVAPSQEAMVLRWHPETGAPTRHVTLGLGPALVEGPGEGTQADQCAGGDRRHRSHVPSRLRPTALPRAGRCFL